MELPKDLVSVVLDLSADKNKAADWGQLRTKAFKAQQRIVPQTDTG